MTHIHIDMLGGIAGDMFLAAAIDTGLIEVGRLEAALSSLGVGDISVVARRVRRGAISGTHVHFEGWDPVRESDHRHLSTIVEMLDDSGLDPAVKHRAQQMFRTLGESESKVHDIPIETVHFHECGALDSIFDFVSAAYIIEAAAASWSAGVVPTGQGTVETGHGTVPVPVPASADILAGFEVVARPVEAELITPTGATILKTLRRDNPGFERPSATVDRVGYGAGSRELGELSNVVRFLMLDTDGSTDRPPQTSDVMARLVCEIDDMNPELYSAVDGRLFAAGAVDVVREPVVMKKGRQGTRLSVLCDPVDRPAVADVIFAETTTFGVRVDEVERLKLGRKLVEVHCPAGAVHIKVGYSRDDQPVKAAPEYDDCVRLADQTGRPVRDIYEQAVVAAREYLDRLACH